MEGKDEELEGIITSVPSSHHEMMNGNKMEEHRRFGHGSLLDRRRSINVAFRDIVYTVSVGGEKKQILKSVSGEFRPGELTAIMGSSGAGKSTLMNVIAGLIRSNVKGDILINGAKRVLKKFRKISCYIMQADELCPLLTVTETMELAANLKLGNSISAEAKKPLISEILETIGLTDVKDTRASILSSGERKRLAIALELVNNPPVLFFDEPTSRLDSSSCVQFVSLLRSLARSGRTVICVIHQPSSSVFEMFDQLYMMAEGQCIYQGRISGLVNYLSTSIGLDCPKDHNPADYIIDVSVGKYGRMVEQLVEANKEAQSAVSSSLPTKRAITEDAGYASTELSPTNNSLSNGKHHKLLENPSEATQSNKSGDSEDVFYDYNASFFVQFALLYKKCLRCSMRDLTLTYLRLAVQIFLAIIVGVLYFGIGNEASKVYDNVSLLFVNQFILMFTAVMAISVTFPLELPVLVRENLNNWYSIKAYYLAKSSVDFPFEVIYTSIYVVIVYFMTDQPHDVTRFFLYLIAGLMDSFVAQSVGMTVGIAFQLETAIFVALITLPFCILYGGVVLYYSTAPVYLQWTFYLVYLRYSFKSSVMAIYGYGREKLDCSTAYCIFKEPETILEQFEVADTVIWVDMLAMVAYFFIMRALAYFLLWRRIRNAKP